MNIELLQDHWVNGRKFTTGTILDLPEPCARNLIEAGAAQAPDLPAPPRLRADLPAPSTVQQAGPHRRRLRQAEGDTPTETQPQTPDTN
ncbi:MAG TPA: hypothetical protein PKM73_07210 [Verrucomicrobiota bacterium]|nr:hypothetical protein [Verrucomicrobiota bacterium]HNU50151.1 hypothetical protein [Verrucomicrobiota bacterium]